MTLVEPTMSWRRARAPRIRSAKPLAEDAARRKNWKSGPLPRRTAVGGVRKTATAPGTVVVLAHDHARGRAYRLGKVGLSASQIGKVVFASGCPVECEDPILKERLFGLAGPEGNHGEDVKELYYYLDATPTSSYLRALYKYPQGRFPYDQLVAENGRRGKAKYRVRDGRAPGSSRRPVLRRLRRVRQGGARRHPDSNHLRQSGTGRR